MSTTMARNSQATRWEKEKAFPGFCGIKENHTLQQSSELDTCSFSTAMRHYSQDQSGDGEMGRKWPPTWRGRSSIGAIHIQSSGGVLLVGTWGC